MPRTAPKLSTIRDIGKKVFVEGTHGLTESKYRELLKHPETARIFREHGIIGVNHVLYGLVKGQETKARSTEQERKIFKALKAIAGAPHAEEIRRSVGMGHKTTEQLMKEAARREGPSDADKKAHHEKMMLRAKADRRQQELYVQSRARLRSTAAGETSIGEDRRDVHTSASDRPKQAPPNPASAPPQNSTVEIASGSSQLAATASETPLTDDTLLAPTQLEKTTPPPKKADKSDVHLPPPADETGLPL